MAYEQIKELSESNVLAIYLSGSHLNNTYTDDSDYDYLVITQPKLEDILSNNKTKSLHTRVDGDDVTYIDLLKFTRMITKCVPNTVELFYKYPVYCSEYYTKMADWLFDNQEALPNINPVGFVKSCQGLFKNSLDKIKGNSNEDIKQAVYAIKSYSYLASQALYGKLDINLRDEYDSFKDSSMGSDSDNFAAKKYLNDSMNTLAYNNAVMDSFKNKQDTELKKDLYTVVKDTLEFS